MHTRKLWAMIMLAMALGGGFIAPMAWTATNVFLTPSNVIAGSGISVNATSTTVTISTTGSAYTDENAQDAVGGMVDSTLVYTDSTPLLQRAALTGDVNASAGSNTTSIASSAVTTDKIADGNVTKAKIENVAASKVLGRGSSGGAGAPEEITLGTGLTMSGTTMSASGAVDPTNCTTGAGSDSWACGAGSAAAGARGTGLGDEASASADDTTAVGQSSLASAARATAIGSDATASSADTVAIGDTALASNSGNVIIGSAAGDGGFGFSVAVGYSSLVKNLAVAIGYDSDANCANCVSVGYQATTSAQDSVAIGKSATASGSSAGGTAVGTSAAASGAAGAVAIGHGASAAHNSIALGRSATTTANNQLIIGSNNVRIADVYISEGVTDTSPSDVLLSTTGGSGTNVAGGNLTLRGGLATGNAATGDVIIAGANAGASSSTLQTAANRWLFKGGTGHLVTGADNTYDIGADGATRPRSLYLGTRATMAEIKITGGSPGSGKVLTSDGSGVGTWQDTGIPAGVPDGSGTANRLAKWSDSNTLTNSLLSDDGSNTTVTSGQFLAVTGFGVSEQAPGYGFSGDTNTGMGQEANDRLAFIVGGKRTLRLGVAKTLTDNVAASIVTLGTANDSVNALIIRYAVQVESNDGGTVQQAELGELFITDRFQSSAHADFTATKANNQQVLTSGSLTVSFALSSNDVQVTANTSLADATLRIDYSVENLANQATEIP